MKQTDVELLYKVEGDGWDHDIYCVPAQCRQMFHAYLQLLTDQDIVFEISCNPLTDDFIYTISFKHDTEEIKSEEINTEEMTVEERLDKMSITDQTIWFGKACNSASEQTQVALKLYPRLYAAVPFMNAEEGASLNASLDVLYLTLKAMQHMERGK